TIIVDEVAPNVRAYFGSASTGMIQGSFDLMHSYNGDARQGFGEVDNPEDWEFVFPTPSANLWMDCWAIATGAPHPDAAHAFINFMIAEENAMTQIEYIGYPIGVRGSEEKARDEGFEDLDLIFPDQKILDRLETSEFNEGTRHASTSSPRRRGGREQHDPATEQNLRPCGPVVPVLRVRRLLLRHPADDGDLSQLRLQTGHLLPGRPRSPQLRPVPRGDEPRVRV